MLCVVIPTQVDDDSDDVDEVCALCIPWLSNEIVLCRIWWPITRSSFDFGFPILAMECVHVLQINVQQESWSKVYVSV